MDEEREDTVSSGAAVYFRKKGGERERERERERVRECLRICVCLCSIVEKTESETPIANIAGFELFFVKFHG